MSARVDLRKLADYVTDLLESTTDDGVMPEPWEELYLAREDSGEALTPRQRILIDNRRHDAYATAEERLADVLGFSRCVGCGKYVADGWERCGRCQNRHHNTTGVPA